MQERLEPFSPSITPPIPPFYTVPFRGTKRIISALLSVILATFPLTRFSIHHLKMTDKSFDQVLNADFDREVAAKMQQWKVPGCAIALVPLGQAPIFKTYHEQGYQPISTKTRFPLAAITRMVSAFAIIKALEAAGYDKPFDVLIKDVLPGFKLSDANTADLCTVRDVLGHRCNAVGPSILATHPIEKATDYVDLIAGLPIVRPIRQGPGIWSGEFYQLVQPIIELLTGKSFEAYVREAILDPLGMTSTGFSAAEAGEDMALGYQIRHGATGVEDKMMTLRHGYDKLGAFSGLATLRMISTIEDMAKLVAYLPTAPHFLSEMAHPFTDPSTWIDGDDMAGAGTNLWWNDGHLLMGHAGVCPGFRTQVFHIPSIGCGLSILTNSTEGADLMSWIDAWVIGSLTGVRDQICERACARIERGRKEFRLLSISACPAITGAGNETLIGDFYSKTFGTISFSKESNVATTPRGQLMDVPWLPHLYGSVRLLVTSLGKGRFEGCLEWTAGPDQEQCWGKQYGFPFSLLLVTSGGEKDELWLRGMDWVSNLSGMDWDSWSLMYFGYMTHPLLMQDNLERSVGIQHNPQYTPLCFASGVSGKGTILSTTSMVLGHSERTSYINTMADKDFTQVFNADFDRQVAEKMAQWRVPGCAIALVPLGQPPFFKTYHQEGFQAISIKTRFPLAILTRMISAFALIKALEAAGYDKPFDVLITHILPTFKLSDSRTTELCTIRDVIGHQCNAVGPSILNTRPVKDSSEYITLVAGLPIVKPLREGSGIWSPAIYQLVQPIIELLTGKTFEAYVREAVLEPLGMTSTGFSAAEAGEDLAVGYNIRHGDDPSGEEDSLMPLQHGFDSLGEHGGLATLRLISTIEDMAKLVAFLPSAPHFLSEMGPPLTDPSTWTDGEELVGAGTHPWWNAGHVLMGHAGLCPGFRTQAFHIPSVGCGLSILTNSTEGKDLSMWIDAWVTGSLTGVRDQVCQQTCERYVICPVQADPRIEKSRKEFRVMAISDCPAITGAGTEQLIGDFHSDAFGMISFMKEGNVQTRPRGGLMDMPWLPHLYGNIRNLVTSRGGGKFDGCLEWTPRAEEDQAWGIQHGFPYTIELVESDGGDELRLWGMDWPAPVSNMPPIIFHRVVARRG